MKKLSCAILLVLVALPLEAQLLPGTVDLSFDAGSALTRPVYATALLPDGKLLITGDFTAVDQAAANGVAQLRADGATDLSFTNSLQGIRVNGRAAVVRLDGKLLVGGNFANTGLRLLNPDGSLDPDFMSPVASTVYSMAIQPDGKVLVAGSFNSAGRRGVLRLNTDGSVDQTFLYGLAGANNTVQSVALLPNGKVLIGGLFTSVNGIARPAVARLNPNGTLDETFAATVTNVYAVAYQSDGKVLVGGDFSVVNGAGLNRLARLNSDGSLDSGFLAGLSGADAPVYAIHVQSDGKLLVGGTFTNFNGTSRRGFVRLNANGAVDAGFTTGSGGINGAVYSITLDATGQAIVAGSFNAVGGVPRNQIARLGSSGSLDTSFGNGSVLFTGAVTAIAVQSDGKVLVNSVLAKGIGRLHTNGLYDTSFLAGFSGANGAVNAIATTSGGKILVAGQFSQFNSFPARALVRLDNSGSVDPAFQNGLGSTTGSINCMLLLPDGKILIGGLFNQIRGVSRTNLARLNTDGSLDNTFLTGMNGVNGEVTALALDSTGKVLVGGNFTMVNGVARGKVARLNPDGALDRTFQESMAGIAGTVNKLAVQPDLKVVVAGRITQVNGAQVSHIARLEVDGSRDTNFTTGTISSPATGITALALQADGRILIGGDFTSINVFTAYNSMARLLTNGAPESFLQSPNGAAGPVTSFYLLNDTQMLVGGSYNSFNQAARSYLAQLVYNAPSVPLDLALNNPGVPLTNDLAAPWQGQSAISHDGIAAAQSGVIADSQRTSLRSSVTGPGCLTFWWKVSSEQGWDFLTFTCTGAAMTNTIRISGEVDWEQKVVCVPAGVFTLDWTYAKDFIFTMGQDAAWLDEVVFTPGNLAPLITLNPLSSTNFGGDTVRLSADATGIPPLRFQWLHEGAEIPNATNLTCVLDSVVPEQAGTYSLRVANDYGATYSSGALLTILPVRSAGSVDYGQTAIEMSTINAMAVAAGQYHSMILKHDGTIYAWGNNLNAQCVVPPTLGPARAIAAGGYHSLAVREDGTVAGWGDNIFGQSVPPAGLVKVASVSAGLWHSLALKEDGTVVGWGDNTYRQASPPVGLSNVIAIAAGGNHSLALRADGIVAAWGANLNSDGSYAGQASVPWGLDGVVAIGAGGYHSLAVKNDGSIVGWGDNSHGQLSVPTNLPPAVGITGGGAHTVAILGDGTAAAWGENFEGQCNISRTVTNVVSAAAGQAHTLLLFGQRPPAPEMLPPRIESQGFVVDVATYNGKLYALEHKSSITATNWTTLPAVRGTGRTVQLVDPNTTAQQRYYRVRQW